MLTTFPDVHTYSTIKEIGILFFSVDFSHISAQTIFSFLDYLTRWARLKADSTCKTQILTSRAERANQNSSGTFLNHSVYHIALCN